MILFLKLRIGLNQGKRNIRAYLKENPIGFLVGDEYMLDQRRDSLYDQREAYFMVSRAC